MPKKIIYGQNDLYTWSLNNNSILIKEWTGLEFDTGELLNIKEVGYSSKKKVLWKCYTCSKEWYSTISNRTVNSNRCPKCGREEQSIKMQRPKNPCDTLENMLNTLGTRGLQIRRAYTGRTENGTEISLDNIAKGSNISLEFKCSKGHIFYRKPHGFINSTQWCPYCSGQKVIKGDNDLKTWCNKNGVFGEILLKQLDENENPSELSFGSKKVVNFKCIKCGNVWKSTINNRTAYKTGCPKCNRSSTSFGEQLIYRYYNKIYKNVQNRIKTIDGYEFDIAIFDLNACIEYNGMHWHSDENTIQRDKEKRELCNKHNIKLITVWQSHKILYSEDDIYIDNPRDYDKVSNMINQINKELDIKDIVKDELLKEAMYEAYKYMNGIDI